MQPKIQEAVEHGEGAFSTRECKTLVLRGSRYQVWYDFEEEGYELVILRVYRNGQEINLDTQQARDAVDALKKELGPAVQPIEDSWMA